MESETTFIYALVDPIEQTVRYVGKSNYPDKRIKSHLNRALKLKGGGPSKDRWIHSLWKRGLRPQVWILEEVHKAEWGAAEVRWIEKFRAEGAPLTNLSDGGPQRGSRRKKGKSKPWIGEYFRNKWLKAEDEARQK
jgi:hypothetical protein